MSLDIRIFLPFEEAIAWAKSKDVVLPDDYYGNRIGIARAQAFSVAGLASLDQLEGIKSSLDNALTSGTSFFDWQKQVKDGAIPLDLPKYRLDNIFRTNTQSAYMAGRWQQLKDSSEDNEITYLIYDAVNDSRTRPAHKAMDNVIKPMGDKFWQENYPPNGFRCRCTVRRLSKKQVERLGGITPDTDIPPHAKADTGWDYNVGESRGEGIKKAIDDKKITIAGGSEFKQTLKDALEQKAIDKSATISTILLKHTGKQEAKDRFNTAFSDVQDVRVLNMFASGQKSTNLSIIKGRSYYSPVDGIRMRESANSSVFVHEYGHFYDIVERRQLSMSQSWIDAKNSDAAQYYNPKKRAVKDRFLDSFKEALDEFDALKESGKISQELYNYTRGALHDIFDAFSVGKARDLDFVWSGHGSDYYKQGEFFIMAETFTQMVQIKAFANDALNAFINEKLPALHKVVEELLNEF